MNFKEISDWIRFLLREAHLSNTDQAFAHLIIGLIALFLLCFVFWAVSRFIIIRYVKRIVRKSSSKWDDQLYKFKVFRTIAFILIAITIVKAVPYLFEQFPNWITPMLMIAKIYVVLSVMFSINALLNALLGILEVS